MTSPAIKKNRDSNMELLRITAMLLILLIHASYRALPLPDATTIEANPSSSFLQLMTRSFAIIGVNVFVMLSGWFGIRPRLSRLAELLFQILFFGLLCLTIEYLHTGHLPLSPVESIKTLFMLSSNSYWFLKCYIALYLISPVLNAFVEHATKRQFGIVLGSLFVFQFVFGWIIESTSWLCKGYSLPSFMCLYLLARYLNICRPWFARFSRLTDLSVYIGTAAIVTLTVFLMRRYFNLGGVLYFYNSPTTILSATFLLLFFSKLSLRSRLVNWLGISVLSIYLTHSSSFTGHYYDELVRLWFYNETRPLFLLYTALLIVGVFFGSILIDKVRLLLWRIVGRIFE
jgi:hypothetical protein